MISQPVKIGGGGVASLSCAINLKLNGFDVLICEKNKYIGQHHHNDWEGLENWTSDENILEFLRRINIKPDFFHYPCQEIIGLNDKSEKHKIESKVPLFYLVKRGPDMDSMDQHLKKQAQRIGVNFEFNKTIEPQKVDIVGIGHRKQSFGIALGIKFETDLPNTVMCILNNKIAPQAYAYMIVFNNQATLAACFISFKKYLKTNHEHLNNAVKEFQKTIKFSIKNPQYFAGCASLGFLKNKDKIYIGEAGGLQDGFLGFGMKYALLSGYLASQAILKAGNAQKANKIYWQYVKKEIYPLLKTSVVNRFIYEFFSNKTYTWLLKKTTEISDFRKFIQKQYQPSFYKNILFPFAKIRAKKYLID